MGGLQLSLSGALGGLTFQILKRFGKKNGALGQMRTA